MDVAPGESAAWIIISICVGYNSAEFIAQEATLEQNKLNRRYFFYGTLLVSALPASGAAAKTSLKAMGYKSPNEKLNIACIGAGGKAASDIRGCGQTENIVALCDVDDARAQPNESVLNARSPV